MRLRGSGSDAGQREFCRNQDLLPSLDEGFEVVHVGDGFNVFGEFLPLHAA